MITDGKYEPAATALAWTRSRFAGSPSVAAVERVTGLKLMAQYQEFDPVQVHHLRREERYPHSTNGSATASAAVRD